MKKTILDLLVMIKENNAPQRFIWNKVLWYLGESDNAHYYANNGERRLEYIKLEWLDEEIEILDGDK